MRVSCTSCPINALTRPPRSPWEETRVRSPKLGTYGNEESYDNVQRSAGEGLHGIVECLEVSQEDTTQGPLWKKILGRSLGSHDAAERVGRMCHGNGCPQEITRLPTISCTKTRWSSLTQNWVLHETLARSLRESKVQCVVEDTWPFQERASGQNGRLNPLRMAMRTEARALFDNHPRRNKTLLLGITKVNPCASFNLENAARHVGKHHADAVKRIKASIGAHSRYVLPPPLVIFT